MARKKVAKGTKKKAAKTANPRSAFDDIRRLIAAPQRPAMGPPPPSTEQKCLKAIDVLGGAPLATAHHEAGHALVGVYLGRKLRAGILLSKREEVQFFDRKDETDVDLETRVRIAIAGPIAEATFAGHSAGFSGDIEKAWKYAGKLDKDDEAASVSRLTHLAAEVRAILAAAPVEQVARAIVQGKARTKKKLEAGLRGLEWAEGVEIAMDEGVRAANYLALAAPALQLTPALRALVQRFVASLPDESRAWLFRHAGAIRFVGRDDVAYVSRIGSACSPCFVVVLRADLAQLPQNQAFAVVAHELGHVRHHHRAGRGTDAGTPGEIQADSFVLECGFATGLREHLSGQQAGNDDALGQQLRERIAAIDAFIDLRRGEVAAEV